LAAAFGKAVGKAQACIPAAAHAVYAALANVVQLCNVGHRRDERLGRMAVDDVYTAILKFQPVGETKSIKHESGRGMIKQHTIA